LAWGSNMASGAVRHLARVFMPVGAYLRGEMGVAVGLLAAQLGEC
jgi:hypothetical protein